MKILDSDEKRKWNFHKANYSKGTMTIDPNGKVWAKIMPKGSVDISLLGRKISGSGDVTLRVLREGGQILFSRDIKFSKKSWTEIKFNIDYINIKNAIKIELTRGSRSFGRVELGRVVIRQSVQSVDKNQSKIKKKKIVEKTLAYCDKKRVAIVIPYGIYGGGEIFLKNLLNNVREDFSIDFLYMSKNKLENQKIDPNISHIYTKSLNKLSAVLSSNVYDIIIFYNSKRVYEVISGLRQSGKIKSKIIEIYHSDFRWSDAVSLLKTREGVDRLFRVSPNLAEDISGISDDKKKLLPVGIDTNLFVRTVHKDFSIKIDLNISKDKIIFGMVSRLSAEKDIEYAIELIKNNDKAHLIIVGDGPRRASLHSLLEEGVKNVSLVGYKSNVIDYYNIFDAFLLTSKMEGTPISILEAMSCGLPIYSTDVGEIRTNFGDLDNFYFLNGDTAVDSKILEGQGLGENYYENLRNYVISRHDAEANSELFFNYLRDISLTTALFSSDLYTLSGEYV